MPYHSVRPRTERSRAESICLEPGKTTESPEAIWFTPRCIAREPAHFPWCTQPVLASQVGAQAGTEKQVTSR